MSRRRKTSGAGGISGCVLHGYRGGTGMSPDGSPIPGHRQRDRMCPFRKSVRCGSATVGRESQIGRGIRCAIAAYSVENRKLRFVQNTTLSIVPLGVTLSEWRCAPVCSPSPRFLHVEGNSSHAQRHDPFVSESWDFISSAARRSIRSILWSIFRI